MNTNLRKTPEEFLARRVIHYLSKFFAWFAVSIITFMMIAITADVLRRYFTGASIPGVTEMGEILMVGSVFCGLAYAESQKAHVNVTLFLDHLPPRLGYILNIIGLIIVLIILIWMVVVTSERALVSIAQNEFRFGLVRVPVWPGRIAIALGLMAYFFEVLIRLVDEIYLLTKANKA